METNTQNPTSVNSLGISSARAAVLRTQANPELMEMITSRRQQAAQRLKERYSHKPFYAAKAKKYGEEYWLDLADSAVNAL